MKYLTNSPLCVSCIDDTCRGMVPIRRLEQLDPKQIICIQIKQRKILGKLQAVTAEILCLFDARKYHRTYIAFLVTGTKSQLC